MKKRLIASAAGLVLLAVIIYFFEGLFLNVALAIVGQIALYEAVKSFCGRMRLPLYLVCSLYFISYMFFDPGFVYPTALLIFLMAAVMMSPKEKINFRDAAGVFFVTMLLTVGFWSILYTRTFSSSLSDARIMFGFGLGLGWVCDSLAYLVGRKFGKRKMSPNISPNKTVEGAIGGISGTVIVAVAAYAVCVATAAKGSVFYGKTAFYYYLFFAAVGLFGAVIGMVGDLAFSYIKRECKIKDFGKIMPGHGGALDRLDSVLFTSLFASFAFRLFINYL